MTSSITSMIVAAAAIAVACLGACKQQRVEYRTRPDFYKQAALGKLADEVTLEDGTVIRYRTNREASILGRGKQAAGEVFHIREEYEDGTIVLRALLPEHVLMNTLTCVQNEEYELLWEQMLSQQTRDDYENNGGQEAFIRFFRKYRHDLAATLTRMVAGFSNQEVSVKRGVEGFRCRLRPQVAEPYKFKIVDIIKEGPGLKLLVIR